MNGVVSFHWFMDDEYMTPHGRVILDPWLRKIRIMPENDIKKFLEDKK